MMECPCRDCKEREVGCHGACIKYKDWYVKNEELRNKRYKETQVNRWIDDDIVKKRISNQRRRGKIK